MLATIIVSAVLLLIVAMIITKMVRDKKSGKGGCGCGCSSCANSAICHGSKTQSTHKSVKD